MRALAQDRVAAQLMGVEVDRYTMIGFAMGAMLAGLLAYQMARQATRKEQKTIAQSLAQRLTALALLQPKKRLAWLGNFMSVAEFLARETRSTPVANPSGTTGAQA